MGIQDFFRQNNRIAIAFSGGVDSAYLLAEAVRCGADVKAYYVKSAFQPGFELDDAERTADFCGAELTIITTDILSHKSVTSNPPDRCYWCKRQIMGAIIRAAEADGFDFICDGTNASDDVSDRPGFRALSELGIRSPLRECGITKDEIRSFLGNGVVRLIESSVPDGTSPKVTEATLADFRSYYLEHSLDETRPFPGITDMLRSLRARGKNIAIVSNKFYTATQELARYFFQETQ